MIVRLTPAAVAIVRLWTRLYTCGMRPEAQRDRRAEIDSDLWEHGRDDASDLLRALQIVARVIVGIPDDVTWRIERVQIRLTNPRRLSRAVVFLGAMAVVAWLLFPVRVALPALPPAPASASLLPMWPAPPPLRSGHDGASYDPHAVARSSSRFLRNVDRGHRKKRAAALLRPHDDHHANADGAHGEEND